ncbi:hypothetical protein FOXYSP1_09622 [Fusarium oxysporum f. sp. phaseoli]
MDVSGRSPPGTGSFNLKYIYTHQKYLKHLAIIPLFSIIQTRSFMNPLSTAPTRGEKKGGHIQ